MMAYNLVTNDGTQMVLDASNNVGIGTTTPAEKLTVSGNIQEQTITMNIQENRLLLIYRCCRF